MILGAILAGGQSRRFGADKAVAEIGGTPLIVHVIDGLRRQVDAIAICGRDWPGLIRLEDDPPGGFGPLAGLNAALGHAQRHGFRGVLAAPVDVYPLPDTLAELLVGDRAAVLARQHLLSWWPVELSAALAAHVAGGDRTFRSWIDRAGARRVPEPFAICNINRPEDMPPADRR